MPGFRNKYQPAWKMIPAIQKLAVKRHVLFVDGLRAYMTIRQPLNNKLTKKVRLL